MPFDMSLKYMHVAVNNVQGFMGKNVHKDGWCPGGGNLVEPLDGRVPFNLVGAPIKLAGTTQGSRDYYKGGREEELKNVRE